MSDFTTIQIRKETKQKLDLMKAENKESYDKLIQNLLSQTGGVFVDDVITIQREKVALSLKYWELANVEGEHMDSANFHTYDITFKDLREKMIGAMFTANANPASDNFVNSVATLVAREGDNVILLVKEISCRNGNMDSISSVVHVNLF